MHSFGLSMSNRFYVYVTKCFGSINTGSYYCLVKNVCITLIKKSVKVKRSFIRILYILLHFICEKVNFTDNY